MFCSLCRALSEETHEVKDRQIDRRVDTKRDALPDCRCELSTHPKSTGFWEGVVALWLRQSKNEQEQTH